MIEFPLSADTTAWVITDGKIGDEVHCFGIAEALGLTPQRRLIVPSAPWSWFAPYGPPALSDWPGRPGSPIAPPFPDIAIASGRRTVPYLRSVKRASGGRTFTVFSKDPYRGQKTADVVYVPAHDRLRGGNVIATLTSPHRLTAAGFSAARAAPDARLARLPGPRVAFVLGGPSGQYTFTRADAARLGQIARQVNESGSSLMVTPSRRTPAFVVDAIRGALAPAVAAGTAFVWDGSTGENPYLPVLALADAILITGDSVNMIGEAAMSGAPIHIVETTGGHAKMTWFIDRMVEVGAARRWQGKIEQFTYTPIDATPEIATGIAERYRLFRARAGMSSSHQGERSGKIFTKIPSSQP